MKVTHFNNEKVRHLNIDNKRRVADDKVVTDVPVGTSVTEFAIDVANYEAQSAEITIELAESGNEIIFYYLEGVIDQ